MDMSIQVNRNWSALLQGICQAYEVMSVTMAPIESTDWVAAIWEFLLLLAGLMD